MVCGAFRGLVHGVGVSVFNSCKLPSQVGQALKHLHLRKDTMLMLETADSGRNDNTPCRN